ncbi:hypothetical protein [Mesorhizobium erdmanii]|uniref:hypothetical protein n=1 Tax=Mesorhizobium erdmanii TaxID=1777866 RepID=UPI0003F4D9AE|nr:hypothetical protein [Mesorhizobium erdmanii]
MTDAVSRDRSDPNFIRLRDEVLSWLGVSRTGNDADAEGHAPQRLTGKSMNQA